MSLSHLSFTNLFPEEITFKNVDQSDLKRPEELNGVEQLHIVDVETKQPGTIVWRLRLLAIINQAPVCQTVLLFLYK